MDLLRGALGIGAVLGAIVLCSQSDVLQPEPPEEELASEEQWDHKHIITGTIVASGASAIVGTVHPQSIETQLLDTEQWVRWPAPKRLVVASLTMSSDGRWLLAGGHDGSLMLWTMSKPGSSPVTIPAHQAPVYGVAFSPDSSSFVTADDDGVVQLWDTATAGPIRRFDGHGAPTRSIGFSADGERLLVGGSNGTVSMWDICTGELRHRFESNGGDVRFLCFLADDDCLVTGDTYGPVRTWRLMSDGTAQQLGVIPGNWSSMAMSKDGSMLATGTTDGNIAVWSVNDLTRYDAWKAHEQSVCCLQFTDHDRALLSIGLDGSVEEWEPGLPRGGK